MFPIIKTLKSIRKAHLIGVMAACAGLAIIIVISIAVLATTVSTWLVEFDTAWVNTLFGWSVGIVSGIGGWFMLPAIIVLISALFQQQTIQRVEQAFYPKTTATDPPKFWPDLFHDIRFTLLAICLNILVLPLYFLLIGPVVSVILNSYLLGREFFETAAGYHLGKPAARKLGQNHKRAVYGGGLIITLLTLTPIINLCVPLLAVVWMVHVFHYVEKNEI